MGLVRAGLLGGALVGGALAGCQAEVDFGPVGGPPVISPALPGAEEAGSGLTDAGASNAVRDAGTSRADSSDAGQHHTMADGAVPDGSIPETAVDGAPGQGADAGRPAPADSGVDRSDPAWPLSVAVKLQPPGDASASPGFASAWRAEQASVLVDGDVRDWSEHSWLALEPAEPLANSQAAQAAACALRWDDGALYLAVVVRDERHVNIETDAAWLEGDGVQLTGAVGGGPEATWQYGWALTREGAIARSWLPTQQDPSGQMHFSIRRRSGITTYEIELTPELLYSASVGPSLPLALELVVNDADGAGDSTSLLLVGGELDAGTRSLVPVEWY